MRWVLLLGGMMLACGRAAPVRPMLVPQMVSPSQTVPGARLVERGRDSVQVGGTWYPCLFEIWSNGVLTLPRPAEPAVAACVAAFNVWSRARGPGER